MTFAGEMRYAVPLSGYTSWRVGGPARRLFRPADEGDLARFLLTCPPFEPLLWIGLGSNLLVRDGGFDGTVIATQGRMDGIEALPGGRLWIGAGATCPGAARAAARAGLVGIEFLAGIPGTLGGALAMNAGAFGGETWRLVEVVRTIDRQGRIRERLPAEYRVGYRHVEGPAGEWFLGARLRLTEGDTAGARARMQTLLERRGLTQPIGEPSCGSVFRNPEGDYAARLIEACGLKGRCKGGAQVSEKHANFIVNRGGARAAEIEALIAEVQAEVEARQGVRLVTEVHMVGGDSPWNIGDTGTG